MFVAIVLARALDDLVVGESTRGLADQALLVGELEVHGGARYRSRGGDGAAPAVRLIYIPCLYEAGGSVAVDVAGDTWIVTGADAPPTFPRSP